MKTSLRLRFAAAILAAAFCSALLASAQHGGAAPEMKPLPVAEKAAPISLAEGVGTDPALAEFFRDFAEALRTHDGKPFVPRLADNYVIEGYPADRNMKESFVKALTMISGPLEIVITAVEPQPDQTRVVKTAFKFAKRTAAREFRLTPDYKLISTSLISMKRPPGEAPKAH